MSYLIAAGVSLLIGLLLWLYFRRIDPASLQGYVCKDWCEARLTGCDNTSTHPTRVPEQPVNTYTNLMYAAAGVVVLFEFQTPPAFVLAALMLFLCLGSAAYHGLSTRHAGRLDVGAMYTVFAGLAAYAICAALGASLERSAIIMLGVGVTAGALGYLVKGWYREGVNYKIAIFLIVPYLLLVESIVAHGETGLILPTALSFGLFALAMLSWILDRWPLCKLRNWGHGIWHLLTGVAIALLFTAIRQGA